jgi:hypothetical protein
MRAALAASVGRHVGLPFLDAQGVLRPLGHAFGGDHIFARDRPGAGFDPNLPIGIDVAECQVIAFDAVDDALPITAPRSKPRGPPIS